MILELTMVLFGLILGSFGNNIVSGISANKKIDLVRSSCMCGDRKLKYYELIPLFSYLFSNGFCRHCSSTLPFRYFWLELYSALLALLCLFKYDFTYLCFLQFIAFYTMSIIAIIDFYYMIIPNILIIILLGTSIVLNFLIGNQLFGNLIIALLLVVIFSSINYFYSKIKSIQVLGFGDIKYIGVLALFLVFPLSLIGLWISALIAIPGSYLIRILSKKYHSEIRIPFGSFLSAGYILTSLIDSWLINMYYKISMVY